MPLFKKGIYFPHLHHNITNAHRQAVKPELSMKLLYKHHTTALKITTPKALLPWLTGNNRLHHTHNAKLSYSMRLFLHQSKRCRKSHQYRLLLFNGQQQIRQQIGLCGRKTCSFVTKRPIYIYMFIHVHFRGKTQKGLNKTLTCVKELNR